QVGIEVPPRLDELDAGHATGGVRVAKVGEEPCPVRLDEERCIRALEPRQVADVDRVRDEQRLLERRAQAVEAAAHFLLARKSSASRYPSGPLPITRCSTRSAMTENRRQSSRSSTFDRCTS